MLTATDASGWGGTHLDGSLCQGPEGSHSAVLSGTAPVWVVSQLGVRGATGI